MVEFIRRFLLHILPARFHRLRHFGLHASRARAEKLPRCRRLLGLPRALPVVKQLVLLEWLQALLGDEIERCPYCGTQGSLVQRSTFEPLSWWAALLVSLIAQPTRQGVCR